MVDLSVKVARVALPNPDPAGSGTFSDEFAAVIDLDRWAAGHEDGVAQLPGRQSAAARARDRGRHDQFDRPADQGLKYFLEVQLPSYKRFKPPLVCSITSENIEDFAQMARDVSVPGVDAIELNISCPTRQPGGGNFALNEDTTYKVVKLCRSMTQKPLWAKLSPNAGEIYRRGGSGGEGGRERDHGFEYHPRPEDQLETRRSCIGQGYGGISGPGVKPIVLRMVHQCSKSVKIPIIGCGGIMKVDDVVEYLLAGATAVEVGFASFRNPTAMIALIEGLEKWCAKKGITRVAELTGAMLDHPPRDTYEAGMVGIS
jgi:dihydroorotate dehydrogenase (NAD+) catalytic subunit